jgi:hypothetical protein
MFGESDLKILEQAFVHRGGHQRQLHRVAVGLGAGDRLGRNVAAGTGAVLHVELLAQRLAHTCPDDAREDVGWTAGGKPDHQLNRLGRIGRLGLRGGAGRNGECDDGGGRGRAARPARTNRVQDAMDRRVMHGRVVLECHGVPRRAGMLDAERWPDAVSLRSP